VAADGKFGNQYSYSMCPRGQIFRRDADDVTDMSTLRHFMQVSVTRFCSAACVLSV
jgi:hypothetical protein